VGAGGTGSYVLDFLARLGVGDIMVIDPDLMELSNVSRVANSCPSDVGRPKVDVARDGISRANSFARVGTIRGSVTARQVGIELAGVDLAFCCTDNHSSRAVLSQMSYEFGLPVIDIGTQVVLEDGLVSRIAGKVVKIGPGFPCLWCAEDLDSARITEENLPPEEGARLAREGYVRGLDVKEPAVVTYNATVAALASGEMLSWFLGLNRDDDRCDRLSYDGLRGTVRSVSVPRRDECLCSTALMRGLPDQIPWTSHA